MTIPTRARAVPWLVLAGVVLLFTLDWRLCRAEADDLRLTPHWRPWTGCRVEHGEGTVTLYRWRKLEREAFE